MRARRPGADGHDLTAAASSCPSNPRQVAPRRRGLGRIEDADAPVSAADGELSRREFDIGRRCFEHLRRDRLAFLDDLVGRLPMTRLANRIERPECEPPPAETRAVSCAT